MKAQSGKSVPLKIDLNATLTDGGVRVTGEVNRRTCPSTDTSFMNRHGLTRKSLDSSLPPNRKHIRPGPGQALSNLSKSFVEEELVQVKVIGRGSFATVWTARYLEDTLAVKVLHSRSDDRHECPGAVRCLEDETVKEANVIEQKRSKYIVRLIHYIPEKRWLVMEYCKHGSLYDIIHDESKKEIVQDWSNRIRWAANVALGMNVVHNEPPTVLHRDLKPSNIFLDEHFEAKVGDFGLSKQLWNEFDIKSSGSLTNIRMIWQAPEVMQRRAYSRKSDVYSFGVVMHQILMLEGPYGFSSSQSYIDMMIENHVASNGGLVVPEDRSVLPGKWHPCLERYIDLMYRCCDYDPTARPEFGEISKTLLEIQSEYNKWVRDEAEKQRSVTERTLLKVFAFLDALLIVFVLSSNLADFGKFKWGKKSKKHQDESGSDHDCSFAAFIIGLLALALLGVCLFLVVRIYGRRAIEYLKAVCSTAKKNDTLPLSQRYHWSEYGQSGEHLSTRSPFETGGIALGTAILGSGNSFANLPIPAPELWLEIREAFLSELKDDPELQMVFRFCRDHENGQLTQSEWETFIKVLSTEPRVTETATFQNYQDDLTIPMFPPRGLFGQRNLLSRGPLPDFGDGQLAGPSCFQGGPSTSAFQATNQQGQNSSRNASLSFGGWRQLELTQLGDLEFLPRTVSMGVPTTQSAPLETLLEDSSSLELYKPHLHGSR